MTLHFLTRQDKVELTLRLLNFIAIYNGSKLTFKFKYVVQEHLNFGNTLEFVLTR